MNCENIFNTHKKRYAIYHSNPLPGVCDIFHFHLLPVTYIEVWRGLEAFWRTSERNGEETEVSMVLYVVFVATELHSDSIFLQNFSSSNNIKIKNYPLSLKVSRKALALLKQIYLSAFSLHTPYPHRNLNTFHETRE